MRSHRLLFGVFRSAAVCWLGLSVSGFAQESESKSDDFKPLQVWTSYDGKEIEAEFVRLKEKAVVLKLKESGQEADVPLSRLSIDSHYAAIRLGNPAGFNKPIPKAKEKVVIEPFIPEMTLDASQFINSPFPSDPTIEQFLDTIDQELQRRNLFVIWHTLPPKMQSDLEAVMSKAVNKLGPRTMPQIRAILQSVNKVVQEKHEFILGYPAFNLDSEMSSKLEAEWGIIAGLVNALSNPEHWRNENFQPGSIIPWLAGIAADVGPFMQPTLEAVARIAPPGTIEISIDQPMGLEYEILSQSSEFAEVKLKLPGNDHEEEVRFQKVGNVWVIPSQMNDLREQVDNFNAQLDQEFDPSSLNFALMTVSAAVGSLERAKTQEEFNQAIAGLNFGGPGGPGPPGQFGPGAAGGVQGPGSSQGPGGYPGSPAGVGSPSSGQPPYNSGGSSAGPQGGSVDDGLSEARDRISPGSSGRGPSPGGSR